MPSLRRERRQVATAASALSAPASLQVDADVCNVRASIALPAPCCILASLLIAWWLIAAASGPNAYANFEWFMGSLIGRLVLFGYTWALLHHMLGGIRHLIWDTIHGFEPAERELLALATLVGSISLTLIVWVVGYLAMGGPR